MGGVTLCRPRQCSSATNWWKFPSVTFSVSSKDSRGFCGGREVVIPRTLQPQTLRACAPPTATEPPTYTHGHAHRSAPSLRPHPFLERLGEV